jgi:hypothetical protein
MALNKSDIDGLEALKEKTDQYIQDIFDWTAPLGANPVLWQIQDFRTLIETTIETLKKENENDH